MKVWMTAALAASLAAVASAQNANAFKEVDAYTGLVVRQTGNMVELILGQDATVTFNGRTHDLENIQGFWLISDDGDIQADLMPIPNWSVHTNKTPNNSTAGWQTQQRHAIKRGESKTFTFNSANWTVADAFGIKVHAQGTPAHIRLDVQPVPEPATLAALALGSLIFARRRRK
jgi:hypothetical protein